MHTLLPTRIVALGGLSALTGHTVLSAVTGTLAILLPLPLALSAWFSRQIPGGPRPP